ncbi:MAG: ABC transporter ATP-binding protein [Anaerolineae bacterium]|nr:ABC transporter ATP-binding protein [Anaerolineae bacterium]
MSNVVIQAQGLGKRYRIGANEADRASGAKSRFMRWKGPGHAAPASNGHKLDLHALTPNSNGRGQSAPQDSARELWALRDVSFEIEQSQVAGIIGRNGSGKSTLLKILSQITKPTEGKGFVKGRVGSLLEVGSGFHQELTGRENVYMNGAILGMSRREIDRKFEEIVEFAEVAKFIDTPVKHYSSGMHVRLGFAVAAHIEPEILLVDEVLSVGDAAFQKKCQKKIRQISQDGRTVLVVSHNLVTINRLASRALWLHHGQLRRDGVCEDVVQDYLDAIGSETMNAASRSSEHNPSNIDGLVIDAHPDFGLNINQIVLKDGSGRETLQFAPGDSMTVEIHYDAQIRIERPYLWLSVDGKLGPTFGANMLLDGHQPKSMYGTGVLKCTFLSLPLLPQSFTLRMALRANDMKTGIVNPQEIALFRVRGDMRDYGFSGAGLQDRVGNSVPVMLPYVWTMPDGTEHAVSIQPRSEIESM